MRKIEFSNIVQTVEALCIEAAYELGGDVLSALERAAEKESEPRAVKILQQLVENAKLAAADPGG